MGKMKFVVGMILLAGQVGAFTQDQLRELMYQDLNFIRGIFAEHYAMKGWKEKYAGWNLEAEIESVRAKISGKEHLTVKDYHQWLAGFFRSTGDVHVGVSFYARESSYLPFTVRGAKGKYYLAYINRSRLPVEAFPFSAGDELIYFGQQENGDWIKTSEVVEGLKGTAFNSNPGTNQAFSEMTLTMRRAAWGIAVPQGSVMLGIQPAGTYGIKFCQLFWTYQPEQIDYEPLLLNPDGEAREIARWFGSDEDEGRGAASLMAGQPLSWSVPAIDGLIKFWETTIQVEQGEDEKARNPLRLGGKKSFVPALGEKIWEVEEEFHAYIFLTPNRRLIGYVRIPSYGYSGADAEKKVAAFAEIVKKLENQTEALVIDQVNNPGGSLFYTNAHN